MLSITPTLAIDETELVFDYLRAAGPGGQNVNKVSTAVQLRFDLRRSPSLPDEVRGRLEKLAGARLTGDGVLVIEAKHYRTQEQNRQDAVARLVALIQKAAEPPKPRKRTRPSRAAQAERVAEKKRRGEVKRSRQSKAGDWE